MTVTMTREEILAAVRQICEGTTDSNAIARILDQLDEALPHAHISDLIFQDRRNLTPEQIVSEATRKEAEHGRQIEQ